MDKFVKDPAAVLDYTWDWSDFLGEGETIESHTVTSDTEELEVDSSTRSDSAVTAWLSAGEDEQRCYVTCHIQTSANREDDRTIYVLVLDQ